MAKQTGTGVPLLIFHDTTILINFHRAGLLTRLGAVNPGNMRWTQTIRHECRVKERDLDLPGLQDAAESLLGEVLRPRDGEHLQIRQLRTQMARPGDHRDAHLGEAETITIVESRGFKAIIATDDGGASKFTSVPLADTWSLAHLALRKKVFTFQECMALWDKCCEAGGRPPRHLPSRLHYEKYLTESP